VALQEDLQVQHPAAFHLEALHRRHLPLDHLQELVLHLAPLREAVHQQEVLLHEDLLRMLHHPEPWEVLQDHLEARQEVHREVHHQEDHQEHREVHQGVHLEAPAARPEDQVLKAQVLREAHHREDHPELLEVLQGLVHQAVRLEALHLPVHHVVHLEVPHPEDHLEVQEEHHLACPQAEDPREVHQEVLQAALVLHLLALVHHQAHRREVRLDHLAEALPASLHQECAAHRQDHLVALLCPWDRLHLEDHLLLPAVLVLCS